MSPDNLIKLSSLHFKETRNDFQKVTMIFKRASTFCNKIENI